VTKGRSQPEHSPQSTHLELPLVTLWTPS
jgi:hypothetical protein